MPKPPSSDFKTPLIILIALIALFICIFFAMKLLAVNNAETPGASNGKLILRAVDGDTLEMADGEMVRLLCVDAPEVGEVGHDEARDYLSSQISLSYNIRIERQGQDKYNRTLAWIYAGETLVNKEIIELGYGDVFPYDGTNCSRME